MSTSSRSAVGLIVRSVFSEDNVDTLRLWDWLFPDLFLSLRGRPWARHLPNALTFSRLILGVPTVLLLLVVERSPRGALPAVGVLALLLALRLTDIFDGRAARVLGTVSHWGSRMDPVADGLLGFGLAAVAIIVVPELTSPTVAVALAVYFVLRFALDTAVVITRSHESRLGIMPLPNKWGKFKYNLDFAILVLMHVGILAHPYTPWLLTGALLLVVPFAPLNTWFGLKNLQAHRSRLRHAPSTATHGH